jgi:hypothetical protein
MLLRRMIKHVKAQNWTAVALDFVIVVMGVYLGIQFNNWNQSRADRAIERTYLELLQRDLQSIVADVDNQIEFEEFQVIIANAALPIINEPASELRRKKLAMILTQLGVRRTLRIESPTFLDMQSSGRLGLISDPDLRNAIVSYFFHTRRWSAVIDKNNEQFVDQSFNPFTDNLTIGFSSWNEEVMQLAPPRSSRSIMAISGRSVAPELLEAHGATLMEPPDANIWIEIKSRMGKRAAIAAANAGGGANIREATVEISEKIAAKLDGADE